MTHEENIKLDILSGYIGSPLTEEQKEFASDFTKDTISFSDPGTGKTHTLIAGLIMAQGFHGVSGRSINCMSFTKAAVSEMASRYTKLCSKCGLTPIVQFNTFHSLSNAILRDSYPNMRITNSRVTKEILQDLCDYMNQLNLNVTLEEDNKYIRKVARAIDTLNSSLTFHEDNVKRKYAFVELGMDIKVFQELRIKWFVRGITMSSISQGDIPLYCLYALRSKPDIIEKWRGRYGIMIVDEFQDLSLLHLNILSYIANKLIVIGDMKQQIYAFNGACPDIVDEYLRMRPDARICNLTKSFRCSNKISEIATRIIKPNDESIVGFTGHNGASEVKLIHRRDMDWQKVAEDMEAKAKINGFRNGNDTMFLYRNNASAIPILEELYKKKIPFRCPRFTTIMKIPMFESLTKLVDAAWQPKNIDLVREALLLFPEFSKLSFGTEPAPLSVMRMNKCSIFDLKYNYRDPSSITLLESMAQASKAITANKSAGMVYMKVMDAYRKFIYPREWWKLDNDEEYYFNLVGGICNSKTYPIMVSEENDKFMKNNQAIEAGTGVRCYTMHSAKGLEADDVYILDCDEGKFPNAKIMQNMSKAGCDYDIATNIRSERNLLYVAITRAKNNVTIVYSTSEPTKLIADINSEEYTKYDEIYASNSERYNDADEFFKLFNIKG